MISQLSHQKENFIHSAHPAISVVLVHKFGIVVVVEGRVALHALLLAQLVVLSLGAVYRCVGDLKGTGTGTGAYVLLLAILEEISRARVLASDHVDIQRV